MNTNRRVDQQIGEYRLLNVLGRSGFSEVYSCEHVSTLALAAIKLLGGKRTGADAEKFLAQASALTHLSHPYIVPVLDYGIANETAYLVMDYAPGGNLRQRHPRGTRVSLEQIVSYVNQIADALYYVHENKLVHRDVKPHNMLIGENDEAMLSDFGITIVSQSLDPLFPLLHDFEGTVLYAAPEQLEGKPRRASDQYALGIVTYEWLTGSWPFSGTFDEVVHQHLHTPPPALREKCPDIPFPVQQVVLKALEKKPEDRFTHVLDFAEALEWACQVEKPRTKQENAVPQPRRQFLSPLPFPRGIV